VTTCGGWEGRVWHDGGFQGARDLAFFWECEGGQGPPPRVWEEVCVGSGRELALRVLSLG